MDILDEDILNLWSTSNNNKVRSIMVGGFATNIHGYSRLTAAVDIWLENTIENRKQFQKAIKDTGIGDFPMIPTKQFVPGFTTFNLSKGIELDVLTSMKSLEEYTFDDCLSIATMATIENIEVPFLHIN